MLAVRNGGHYDVFHGTLLVYRGMRKWDSESLRRRTLFAADILGHESGRGVTPGIPGFDDVSYTAYLYLSDPCYSPFQ